MKPVVASLLVILSTAAINTAAIAGETDAEITVRPGFTPPQSIHRLVPDYHERLRSAGVRGTVVLDAVVGADGRVDKDVRLVDGPALLARDAMNAVQRWVFQPARQDGEAVRSSIRVTIRFELPGWSQEEPASGETAPKVAADWQPTSQG